MTGEIDIDFDMRDDTPAGKDPDSESPTLRRYHAALWSKPLPDGTLFALNASDENCYLRHTSTLGDLSPALLLIAGGSLVTAIQLWRTRRLVERMLECEGQEISAVTR